MKRVIFVGADGLGSKFIREFPEYMPTLRSGMLVLDMRTLLPSLSANNWRTIFTSVPSSVHGYCDYASEKPELEPATVIDIFSKIRKECGVVAAMYSWPVVGSLFDDTLDFDESCETDEDVFNTFTEIHQHAFDFMLVYFSSPDTEGHAHGWGSSQYLRACTTIDTYLSKILEIAQDDIVVFVSDHGGIRYSHGGHTLGEVEVPFAIFGSNRSFVNRPSTIMDVAPTILELLTLEQPVEWMGRSLLTAQT